MINSLLDIKLEQFMEELDAVLKKKLKAEISPEEWKAKKFDILIQLCKIYIYIYIYIYI